MVCSPRIKRVLSAYFAVMLLFCGGIASQETALAKKAENAINQSGDQLGIVSVRLNADGNGIAFDASRSFSAHETRNLSVLRLPAPYRLLIDIPNARLATNQRVFPIKQQGIDRVELLEQTSSFYNSVRAVVYVADGQILARLNPVFEGNALKVEAAPAIAMTPSQMAAFSPVPQKVPTPVAKAATSPAKTFRAVKPLPPVAKPVPAIAAQKQPPVPPVASANVGPVPPTAQQSVQTVLDTPPAPGTAIVEEVYLKEHRLYLKSGANTDLRVKNRFILTEPSRLVLDIENAVLRSRDLMNPISSSDEQIRQIRVGQFDDKTVRIVIEGVSPEQFEAIYPGSERNLLAITPYSSTSIVKLSANTRLGEVQSIDLKRENGSTVLRLVASEPMVHRFMKKDDRIILDLLNAASHPTAIGFDARQYPEIEKMRLEPLTAGQPNSKLSIQLSDAKTRAIPTLSDDGRVLELLLASDASSAFGSIAAAMDAAGKAPFAARIVVDAGHGGKDIGANRSGVNEKDLNLSLALMVRDALVAKGFKVYMTRSTDEFLPLPKITAITNQIHPDLFISIHHNASVNAAMHGIETYYFTPQSIALAKRVHAREINAVGARDGGVKQARFYVIHHTSVPAILCEVGYVSNPTERTELQSQERKQNTARAIADGVVDYLKTRVSAKAK